MAHQEDDNRKQKKEKQKKTKKGTGFANISVFDLLQGNIPEFETGVALEDVPEPEDIRLRTKAELKRLKLQEQPVIVDEEAHTKQYFEEIRKGREPVSGVNRHGKNLEVERLQNLLDENVCYDEIALKMEPLTPDGGVRKRIMKPGMPGDPIVDGKVVYIIYQVWTEGSDAPLDDSRTHSRVGKKSGSLEGSTFRFKVGCGAVLPALDIAVKTMQIGEIAKVLAEPDYAYGKLGIIGSVPPQTRALLTIEMVHVAEGTATINFVDLDPKERMELPFDTLYKGILELKQYGKDYVEREDFNAAKKEYKKALQITHEIVRMTNEEVEKRDELEFTILNNIGFCCMKLGRFRSAKEYLEDALEMKTILKTKKVKAFYRYGKTLFELGDMEGAKINAGKAKDLDPSNQDIHQLYNMVNQKILQAQDKELEYTRKMFKNL